MKTIEYVHIHNSIELIRHKDKILALFASCFQKELNPDLWDWAYIKNPLGSAIVNLAFIDNQLVGHYAFIPLKTTKYNVLLSMTTMVDASARKYNIFLELAEKSYSFAKELGFDVIIGFPNAKSAIIHEKLLGWSLKQTFIAQCNIKTLQQNLSFKTIVNKSSCFLDILHHDFLHWRLSKPNMEYIQNNQNIFKNLNQNEIDILTLRDENIFNLKIDKKINFITQSCQFEKYKIFSYPFAYKSLDNEKKVYNFYIELLMSDVF